MSSPFIGEIKIVGFNFAPRGWAFCDGQLLSISQNTAPFSLLGTTYGGDGRTTFGLPGLRGRVAVHPGSGPGLPAIRQGERGGVNNVTLTTAQIPSHTHDIGCSSGLGDQVSPENNYVSKEAKADTGEEFSSTSNANMRPPQSVGGSQSHTNMQPYLGVYFCIALVGIFPSRN